MLFPMNSLSFFLHWLSAPLQVGAVAPSGTALAAAITATITADSAPVIELGPGSGAFTRALLERGIPQGRLALVEQSPRFADTLRKRFPHARVLCMDAAELGSVDVFPGEGAGAVVSGLPLLLMPTDKVHAIVRGAFERIRPGGALYQFTYGPGLPVPLAVLERLGLSATRIGRTFANFPPASVYRIKRRCSSSRTAEGSGHT
jgi:phospholipid N-methyltransferase